MTTSTASQTKNRTEFLARKSAQNTKYLIGKKEREIEAQVVKDENKTQVLAKVTDPTEMAETYWDKEQKKHKQVPRDHQRINKVNAQYTKLLNRVIKEVGFYLKTDVNDRSRGAIATNKQILRGVKELVTVITAVKELKDILSNEKDIKPIQHIEEEQLLQLEEAKQALMMVGFMGPNVGNTSSLSKL